nr:alpha/beta fold hydrolase [Polymorphobacter sp.]
MTAASPDPTAPRSSVVLLHGLGRTGLSMRSLAAALRHNGHATLSPWYGSRSTMAEIITYLRPRIHHFAAANPGSLHFVTHSLGGLVARALITAHRPESLGRVVMLAPPNAGSNLADALHDLGLASIILGPATPHLRTRRTPAEERQLGPITYPLGIIAGNRTLDPIFPKLFLPGPNDGKVAVAATKIAGMADHITLPVQHTLMVGDKRVIDQALSFIETGAFKR